MPCIQFISHFDVKKCTKEVGAAENNDCCFEAKEISLNAAIAAVLRELRDVCTLKE